MNELNEDSIIDFMTFGAISPGQGLYDSNPIKGDIALKSFTESSQNHSCDESKHVGEIYNQICKAINKIVTKNEIDSIAVSGGADSRLILSIMAKNHPSKLNELYIYSRVHPKLGIEKDRDFLIAQQVCKKLKIKLTPEISTIHPQFYLKPQDFQFKMPLTGLWGTELLGGTILSNKIFTKKTLTDGVSPDSPMMMFLKMSGINEHNYDNVEYYMHFRILLTSKLTAFYNSATWLLPSAQLEKCSSPFLDEDVVSLLSKIPSSGIINYQLYNQVLTLKCSELSEIPINNNLIASHLKKNCNQIGQDPKEQHEFFNFQKNDPPNLCRIKELINDNLHLPYASYLRSVLNLISMTL